MEVGNYIGSLFGPAWISRSLHPNEVTKTGPTSFLFPCFPAVICASSLVFFKEGTSNPGRVQGVEISGTTRPHARASGGEEEKMKRKTVRLPLILIAPWPWFLAWPTAGPGRGPEPGEGSKKFPMPCSAWDIQEIHVSMKAVPKKTKPGIKFSPGPIPASRSRREGPGISGSAIADRSGQIGGGPGRSWRNGMEVVGYGVVGTSAEQRWKCGRRLSSRGKLGHPGESPRKPQDAGLPHASIKLVKEYERSGSAPAQPTPEPSPVTPKPQNGARPDSRGFGRSASAAPAPIPGHWMKGRQSGPSGRP